MSPIDLPDLTDVEAEYEPTIVEEVLLSGRRTRTLSHTEISAMLDCQAKHDFRYVGQLAGSALRPKVVTPAMREGRMWGRMVAAWHQHHTMEAAVAALNQALKDDAKEQRNAGLFLQELHDETEEKMLGCFAHYIQDAPLLNLVTPERELVVPIPSRTGRGTASSIYRFQTYLDGVIETDMDGRDWIVEFKFRTRLTAFEQVARDRQNRLNAWAWARETGHDIAGIIVDERLAEVPKPARIVKEKRKGEGIDGMVPSHAKDQMCTPDAYIALCAEYGVQPSDETVAALTGRSWQNRHTLILRPGEIAAAGRLLVSAARQIRDLESGRNFPIANPTTQRCGGCAFKGICAEPSDRELVDALFHRTPAKKDRPALKPQPPQEIAA